MTYRFVNARSSKEPATAKPYHSRSVSTEDGQRAALLHNRAAAGQQLATQLEGYADRADVFVLALPRGGVPVGYEIAKALRVPFDVCLVRKLGLPGNSEVAMGAIAADGVRVFNNELIKHLAVPDQLIAQVMNRELKELQRRDRTYRNNRLLPNLSEKTVILVDDGIATGFTVQAAILWLKRQPVKAIVVAVPVMPASMYQTITLMVDRLVCLLRPTSFLSIGCWYEHFGQVSDDEVIRLLWRKLISP